MTRPFTLRLCVVPNDQQYEGVLRVNFNKPPFHGICLPFSYTPNGTDKIEPIYDTSFFYGNVQDLSKMLRRGYIRKEGDLVDYVARQQTNMGSPLYLVPLAMLRLGGERQRTLDHAIDEVRANIPPLLPAMTEVIIPSEGPELARAKQTVAMTFACFPPTFRDRAFAAGRFYKLRQN